MIKDISGNAQIFDLSSGTGVLAMMLANSLAEKEGNGKVFGYTKHSKVINPFGLLAQKLEFSNSSFCPLKEYDYVIFDSPWNCSLKAERIAVLKSLYNLLKPTGTAFIRMLCKGADLVYKRAFIQTLSASESKWLEKLVGKELDPAERMSVMYDINLY